MDRPFRQQSCHSPLLPLSGNLTPCHIPPLVIILMCRKNSKTFFLRTVNSWLSVSTGCLCSGSTNTTRPNRQKHSKHIYLTLSYFFCFVCLTFEMCVAASSEAGITLNKITKLQSWDLTQESLRDCLSYSITLFQTALWFQGQAKSFLTKRKIKYPRSLPSHL